MKLRKTYNIDKDIAEAIEEMAGKDRRSASFILNDLLRPILKKTKKKQAT